MGQGAKIHFNSNVVGKFLDNGETDFVINTGDDKELRCTMTQIERQWILTGQVVINGSAVFYAKITGKRRSDPKDLFNQLWAKVPKRLRQELTQPAPKDVARAYKNSVKKRYVGNLWHKLPNPEADHDM